MALSGMCPCLRGGRGPRDEDFKLLGDNGSEQMVTRPSSRGAVDLQPSTSFRSSGSASKKTRGTWLDEGDELAQFCFQCNKQFSLVEDRRHHCRRCGNTFCAKCSGQKMPLLLYGVTTAERVCDKCYPEIPAENELASKHLPLLQRGVTLNLKTSTLFGGKDMALVKIDKAGVALLVLDKSSVSDLAPRHRLPLADIAAVDETVINGGTSLAITIKPHDSRNPSLKLEAHARRDGTTFAAAARAAAKHAQKPDLSQAVAADREKKHTDRMRIFALQDREKKARERRQANDDLRSNLRAKYSLES